MLKITLKTFLYLLKCLKLMFMFKILCNSELNVDGQKIILLKFVVCKFNLFNNLGKTTI